MRIKVDAEVNPREVLRDIFDETLSYEEFVEMLLELDRDYISDWDFTKAVFEAYQKEMEEYDE